MIIFLEHTPSITAGVNADPKNLITDVSSLKKMGISYTQLSRGGDHTAHEPGQLLIYLHVDLKKRGKKFSQFRDFFTEAARSAIANAWNINLVYDKERPGLYHSNGKKLASMGFYCKSDFTSYGISLNIKNNLSTFKMIHPCGESSEMMESIHGLYENRIAVQAEDFMKEFMRLVNGDSTWL